MQQRWFAFARLEERVRLAEARGAGASDRLGGGQDVG